jgi:hypothetical protein
MHFLLVLPLHLSCGERFSPSTFPYMHDKIFISILISNKDIHPPHIHMWNKNSNILIHMKNKLYTLSKMKEKKKIEGLNKVIKR